MFIIKQYPLKKYSYKKNKVFKTKYSKQNCIKFFKNDPKIVQSNYF